MALTYSHVFARAAKDRWKSTVVGAVSLAVLLVFGMAVYNDIDLSFYQDLPEAFRSMFGIPEGADIGGLAYGAIYSGYGMLTMAAIALAWGSTSIAGEERDGTMGLLLGNPVSRTQVVVEKAAAMFAITFVGFAILWVAAIASPVMLDVEIGESRLTALTLMMFVNALFYGYLAMAISAWTGKSAVAAGTTTGIMVVSFIAVGLLPLIDSVADFVEVIPWHYFTANDPINNGVHWGHFALLTGSSAAFVVAAVIGVGRRDLRTQSVGKSLLDRLRENPTTHRIAEILAGKARVSRIWLKTASEYQGFLYVIIPTLFLMCLMIGPMYGMLDESVIDLADQLPETMLALFGGGDMSTPEGFYQIEMFGLMIPIGIMTVTIAIGTGAMAGEEKRNTMGLLLANPITRSSVVLQKAAAMVVYASVVGFASFLGVAGGSILGGLGMNLWYVAAACVLATLLGLAFGGLSLAIGGATGITSITAYGTVGVAVVTYIVNAFLQLNESTAAWAKASPFYYYLGSDPLLNGMAWSHALVLLVVAIATAAAGMALFNRRDLRARG